MVGCDWPPERRGTEDALHRAFPEIIKLVQLKSICCQVREIGSVGRGGEEVLCVVCGHSSPRLQAASLQREAACSRKPARCCAAQAHQLQPVVGVGRLREGSACGLFQA